MAQGCLANAHHTNNNEELEESGVFMDRSEVDHEWEIVGL